MMLLTLPWVNTGGLGVGRKLSKIEKRGAKVERTTLHIALQELAEIQELQEASIKVTRHPIPSLHNLFSFSFLFFAYICYYYRRKLVSIRCTPAR